VFSLALASLFFSPHYPRPSRRSIKLFWVWGDTIPLSGSGSTQPPKLLQALQVAVLAFDVVYLHLIFQGVMQPIFTEIQV
jgi:hypothetical protein